MTTHLANRTLIVGPATWRYGARPSPADRFMAVQLPSGEAEVNTLLLRDAEVVHAPYTVYTVAGAVVDVGELSEYPFIGLMPAPRAASVLWSGHGLMPLFVINHGLTHVDLLTQVRVGDQDALFIWSARRDRGLDPTDGLVPALLPACVEAAEASRRFLNNHQFYYRTFWPGTEIEHKITLAHTVDVYALAAMFAGRVASGGVPGFLPEYGDAFQQWDFDNVVFEIPAPAEQAGYVSFIPDSADAYVMKRKWFQHDAVRRREQKWLHVQVVGSFEDHIRGQFGVTAAFVGAFRRTRFDVSCESARTGNVYAIMVDRCQITDPGGPDLCQVEIEYLHSRTLRSSAAEHVDAELAALVSYTTGQLDALGETYECGPLSKLTYLRQLRRQSPVGGR